jgi:hypothetical protein
MDYVQISRAFLENRTKSIIIYSAPTDCYDLQILLDAIKASELNALGVSMDSAVILAQGKHPFMLVRRETPLTKDFQPHELISHLAQTPDDDPIEYMLWFYLLTTEQLKTVLQTLQRIFAQRQIIKMTQENRETFFTNVIKNELLMQIDFLPTPLPGSISFA